MTDARSDGKVWDMYSGTSNFDFGTHQDKGSGGKNEGEYYNREHSWPNSWFGGKVQPMYKGDFARTYFYMVTCYEEKLPDWYAANDDVRPTIDGSKYPGLTAWQLKMLMGWPRHQNYPMKPPKILLLSPRHETKTDTTISFWLNPIGRITGGFSLIFGRFNII